MIIFKTSSVSLRIRKVKNEMFREILQSVLSGVSYIRVEFGRGACAVVCRRWNFARLLCIVDQLCW
jgi:hypothetical protein